MLKFTSVEVRRRLPEYGHGYFWRVWVLYPGAGSAPDGFVTATGSAPWEWLARLQARRARRERER